MQMMNVNPNLNAELMLKLVELKKKTLIKNIIEEENKFDPKYKTELCKKFQNTGHCPYGFKCRFAHGNEELIVKNQGANYKKKPCKTFQEKGYCPYGSRCSFQHDERKFSEVNFSYYYFQLFLFKKFNFFPSINYTITTNGSKLIKGRLPIFESITLNNNNRTYILDYSKDIFDKYNMERRNSSNTKSNNFHYSNEDEKKNCLNNELYLNNILKNNLCQFNKKLNFKLDELLITRPNKENLAENIKF